MYVNIPDQTCTQQSQTHSQIVYINPLPSTSTILIISHNIIPHILILVKHQCLKLHVCNRKLGPGFICKFSGYLNLFSIRVMIIVVLWLTHATCIQELQLSPCFFAADKLMKKSISCTQLHVHSLWCLLCSTLLGLNKTDAKLP